MLRRLGAFFLDILEVIVFAIAIFLFIYLLVLQPHKIKGDSMQPNFPNGEYLLTDKVSYRFGEPERGDVVVFEPPGSDGEEYIKRIVGLPGEELSVQDGKLYINGNMLAESYISETLKTSGGAFLNENDTVTVPSDNYFVLGDNRIASSDSRMWGFVKKDKITGRAWIIYWPPPKVGLVEKVTYGYEGS
jgi:signal peptidase I